PIMKPGVPANQDQMVRYVLRPTHTQTETLRAALDSIKSPAGVVATAGNVILITAYASQVRDMLTAAKTLAVPRDTDGLYASQARDMLTLAKTLDVPGDNEGIYTIPVKNADAAALAQKINEILGVSASGAPPAGGGGGGQRGRMRGGAAAPNQPPGAAQFTA